MVETRHGTETAPPGASRRKEQGPSRAHPEHPESDIPLDREGPTLHDMFNDLQDRVIREQRQQRVFLERIYARMEQTNRANAPPNASGNARVERLGSHHSERGEAAPSEPPRDRRENIYGTDRCGDNHGNNDRFDNDRYNNRNSRNVGEEHYQLRG